jgi:hypothetical protein
MWPLFFSRPFKLISHRLTSISGNTLRRMLDVFHRRRNLGFAIFSVGVPARVQMALRRTRPGQ